MKKTLPFLFFLLFSITTIHAQAKLSKNKSPVVDKTKHRLIYKSYKSDYDFKEYSYLKTDKYNPKIAGYLAIIPGLGHLYSGELSRGVGMLALFYGSVYLLGIPAVLAWNGNVYLAIPALFVVTSGIVFSYVWNILDATRVAKIKNMAIQDNLFSFQLTPYFQPVFQTPVQGHHAGLTLSMTF